MTEEQGMTEEQKAKVPLLGTLTKKAGYGVVFVTALQEGWGKEVKSADKVKRKHFVSLKEKAPQAPEPEEESNDTEDIPEADPLVELPAKMARFAPEEWYEILSGTKRPPELKNDYKHIGVAFDASSRLRRAGIDTYHWQLTEKLMGDKADYVFYIHDTKKEALSLGALPPKPANCYRVVCISDTHMLHVHTDKLKLPAGDFLVHAGDLCYEESRSANAELFDKFKQDGKPLCGEEFMKWFKSQDLDLKASLDWLSTRMGYQHKVLCGGNHDYILEQLGPANAKQLCQAYNVTYLHTERPPVHLELRQPGQKSGHSISFWGSGVSFMAGVGAGRAIKSGNNAFQILEWQEAGFLQEQRERLARDKPDIMVVHSGPKGALLSKKGEGVNILEELIKEVKPKLYVCGHAHRPSDPEKGLYCEFGDPVHTLGVNAACTGVWNQRHGYPVVVDLPLPRSSPLKFIGSLCS